MTFAYPLGVVSYSKFHFDRPFSTGGPNLLFSFDVIVARHPEMAPVAGAGFLGHSSFPLSQHPKIR